MRRAQQLQHCRGIEAYGPAAAGCVVEQICPSWDAGFDSCEEGPVGGAFEVGVCEDGGDGIEPGEVGGFKSGHGIII